MTEETKTKPPRKKPPTSHLQMWKPGESGNPKGRPLGARSRLTERMLCDFEKYYKERGSELLKTVERENPGLLLQILAKLIPREASINVGGSVGLDMTIDQRRRIAEEWLIGESTVIEHEAVEPVATPRLPAPARDEQDAIPNRAAVKETRQRKRVNDWDDD